MKVSFISLFLLTFVKTPSLDDLLVDFFAILTPNYSLN